VRRYKIIIEYVGTGLSGWQRQANSLSVQQLIEEAIYKFSGENVTVFSAGRTDAGVHAIAQVAHFDLTEYHDPFRVMQAINHFLRPYAIGVVDSLAAPEGFHSRFDAKARYYKYKVISRPGKLVIDSNKALWIKQPLNVEAMKEAAAYLIGKHDFTSFRAKHCQATSPIKTLSELKIAQVSETINFYLSAPSFLHHMVRNIVGSLLLVGLNKWKPEDIKVALSLKDRKAAGPTAPAHGLYFLKVDY
jgi:tRNA pseudouridine38-40 synthase